MTNFQGLELHSSPARLQKLLNLEKYYLRMQKQKLKEFRVCTNIIILFKYNGKRTILWKQQRAVCACMYIPVLIYVFNVFFPGQVTIALVNTWFQKYHWHLLINNNSIFLGFKCCLMLKMNISLNETSWTMQNMSHVCGADYFHAPVIFSVPLTPKIIVLHWNMSFSQFVLK